MILLSSLQGNKNLFFLLVPFFDPDRTFYPLEANKISLFYIQYLSELSLLKASPFLNYTPSQISSAALALSYYTYGTCIWNKKMQTTFGYELDDLKEVIVNLSEIHSEAESLAQQAIQEKFKSSKYLQVALVKPKKVTIEELDEISSKFVGDELNTTAENIENVRQKTELLFN